MNIIMMTDLHRLWNIWHNLEKSSIQHWQVLADASPFSSSLWFMQQLQCAAACKHRSYVDLLCYVDFPAICPYMKLFTSRDLISSWLCHMKLISHTHCTVNNTSWKCLYTTGIKSTHPQRHACKTDTLHTFNKNNVVCQMDKPCLLTNIQ